MKEKKLVIIQPIDKRIEAEQRIIKKYPKIFKQVHGKITETAMSWGIDCGFGWMGLIDGLCYQLQWDIDHNKQPQLEAAQVKEKFGGLRFYTNTSTDRQDGMIDLAEYLSNFICEWCGTTDTNSVIQTKGWVKTICKACLEIENKK